MEPSCGSMKTVLKSLVFCLLIAESFQIEDQTVDLENRQAPCDCGSPLRRRRVIGGVETEVNEFRWTVMILRKLNIGQPTQVITRLCGGAIVSKKFVVTAAHCFSSSMRANELFVDAGDHDLSRSTESKSIEIPVVTLIKHAGFVARRIQNDIALLELKDALKYSENIQQACLPAYGMDLEFTKVIVSGWGANEEAGPGSDKLMKATLPVISLRQCAAMYNGTDAVINPSVICAGYPDGSQDACQGDSGGPLIYECSGRFSLVGVVSFGIGCGDPSFPGVYTNISFFRDWIISNVDKPSDLCGWNCRPPKTDLVDCGWRNMNNRLQKRVVGGDVTPPNIYPWMVSVYGQHSTDPPYSFVCGATLIGREWILTTVKCVISYNLGELMFILGEYNVDDIMDKTKQVTTPKKILLHPRYDRPFGSNDIALVQLNEKAKLGNTINPICIPPAESISDGITNTVLKLLGFGRISTDGPYSEKLKEVNLRTMTTSACKAFYGIATDNMICTASSLQGDACDGDSGGPLMMKDRYGRHFQLAIQSSVFGRDGKPICGSGSPSINTRIGPYVTWIEQETGILIVTPANLLPPI